MKKITINLIELSENWSRDDKKLLSIRQLSKSTGIRQETIRNYRDGKNKYISVVHLEKLLDFFGCDIDDLIKVFKT